MNASGTRPSGRLRLQILGPLRAWHDDVELNMGPTQQARLLAVLLAREGRPISVRALIDLIWGDEAPASAVNVIHKYVGSLRRLVEPGIPARSSGSYLHRHGSGYRFEAGPETLDVASFRQLVAAAKAVLGMDRPDEALDRYAEALALVRGACADGLAGNPALEAVFAAVDSEVLDATVEAARLAARSGRSARVLGPLRLAAEMAPLNEPVHAGLMIALAGAGHQAEALARYATIRDRLAEDLGIDPGHELQLAHRQVLAQAIPPEPSTDDEVPAESRATFVPPAQLPPDLSSFVGRGEELGVLGRLIDGIGDGRPGGPLVIALDGMGGVGKSTLAVHVAHDVAGQFPDGQLYLDLQGHLSDDQSMSTDDALRSLLYALGVAASDMPGTFAARTGLFRSLTARKRHLVLLDNVGALPQVRPLLPSSGTSLVLLTSRNPLRGLAAQEGARLLHLDLPDAPTARQLLLRRLAGPRGPEPLGGAGGAVMDEIIELCGRLPLALAILAARMAARPRLSLSEVAAELRGDVRLEAFPGSWELNDPRTTFSWSYRQLSPGAARLFRLLSIAPKAGVTVEVCRSLSGVDPDRTRAQLDELADAALVSVGADGRFTSHVLVKAYAEELADAIEPAADRRAAMTRMLQHYLHSAYHAQVVLAPNRTPIAPAPAVDGVVPERPATYAESIAWFAAQREVLKEMLRLAEDVGFGIVPWQLALTMQQYLDWSGHTHDWGEVMRLALRAAQRSADEVGEAHVRRSLAGVFHYLDDKDQAVEQLYAALEIFTRHDMLFEQALTLTNLHFIYVWLERDEEAVTSMEEAMKRHRLLGHPRGEIFGFKATAESLMRLGRPDEAARSVRRAIELNAEHGRKHDETELRAILGDSYLAIGQVHEAITEFRTATRLAREVGMTGWLVHGMISLAEALITAGDLAAAASARDEAQSALLRIQGGGNETVRAKIDALTQKLDTAG